MTLISYISMPVVVDGKTEWVKMDLSNGDVMVRNDDGMYKTHCDGCACYDEHQEVDHAEVVRMCKLELAKMKADGSNKTNTDYAALLQNTIERLDINSDN